MPQLPTGIHDVLPKEARERRAISSAILAGLSSHGYEPVVLPLFELSEVTDAALGTIDQSDVLRFVEPESGEIASLRADMTPQVARLVATRLAKLPGPYRIATEGVVMRRRSGRARTHRQIAQVGAELLGAPGADADAEAISLACESLRRAGLTSFVLELSHAKILSPLLEGARAETIPRLLAALSTKDQGRVQALARGLRFEPELTAICRIFGGADALIEARRLLARTPADAAMEELARTFERAVREALAPVVACDPAEVRHFAYYTGVRFSLFAEGPGAELGGGGRYDTLTARFGADLPAVGFALDADHIAWALRHRGRAAAAEEPGVVLTPASRARERELRAAGFRVVVAEGRAEALEYARAWGYSLVLAEDGVLGASGESRDASSGASPDALRSLLGSFRMSNEGE